MIKSEIKCQLKIKQEKKNIHIGIFWELHDVYLVIINFNKGVVLEKVFKEQANILFGKTEK